MDTKKMFSAYVLDPEHGWFATHRLPFDSAVKYCRENRKRTAGSLVAVVPDDVDPEPYLSIVKSQEVIRSLRASCT
jgi:hypothetical protein